VGPLFDPSANALGPSLLEGHSCVSYAFVTKGILQIE